MQHIAYRDGVMQECYHSHMQCRTNYMVSDKENYLKHWLTQKYAYWAWKWIPPCGWIQLRLNHGPYCPRALQTCSQCKFRCNTGQHLQVEGIQPWVSQHGRLAVYCTCYSVTLVDSVLVGSSRWSELQSVTMGSGSLQWAHLGTTKDKHFLLW